MQPDTKLFISSGIPSSKAAIIDAIGGIEDDNQRRLMANMTRIAAREGDDSASVRHDMHEQARSVAHSPAEERQLTEATDKIVGHLGKLHPNVQKELVQSDEFKALDADRAAARDVVPPEMAAAIRAAVAGSGKPAAEGREAVDVPAVVAAAAEGRTDLVSTPGRTGDPTVERSIVDADFLKALRSDRAARDAGASHGVDAAPAAPVGFPGSDGGERKR